MNEIITFFKIFLGVVVLIAVALLLKYEMTRRQVRTWSENKIASLQPVIAVTFMITLVICVIFSTCYFYHSFLSEPVTTNASATVPLFNTTFVLTSIAFFLTQIILFYFAFRFRASPNRRASHIRQNSVIELVWTLVPAGAFIFIFLWGQVLWAKITAPAHPSTLQIEVVAQQFSWLTRYPGKDGKIGRGDFRFIDNINDAGIDLSDPASQDDFIPIQMHIPKGKPVNLLIRSKDVIHSFYVPWFGVKMDAVPGMVTTLSFTPTATTDEMRKKLKDKNFEYEVACAELCGRMHFAMKLIIVVDESEDFDRWNRQQVSWISQHINKENL